MICLMTCCEQTLLLSAFDPHISPRCFTSCCLTSVSDPFQGSHTCGPKDLKLYQKEHRRENSWQGENYIYIYVYMYSCIGVYACVGVCVYISLPKGLESLLSLWSFKDYLRIFGACKKHRGSEEKTWIEGGGQI